MNSSGGNSPAPAQTPRGKGRGRGRAGGLRGKITNKITNKITKAVGRVKKYPGDKQQAHSERMDDLKSHYTALAKALKPALLDLADRSLHILHRDKKAHERVPEYQDVQGFLDQRMDDVLKTAEAQMNFAIAEAENTRDANIEVAEKECQNRMLELIDEYYDSQLIKLDMLEHMHDSNLPLDLKDDGYLYKEFSDKRAREQGPHVEVRNGIEIPFPQLHKKSRQDESEDSSVDEQPTAPAASTSRAVAEKRKATSQLPGQPETKRAALSANGYDGPVAMPRHSSGLLSGVADEEERQQSRNGSKLPSPTPAEGQSPTAAAEDEEARVQQNGEGDRAAEFGGPARPPSASEEGLPRFTTLPDQYGVRLVNRRAIGGEEHPSNRIVVPQPFEWEEIEIGFRDSTNDPTRGTTRRGRGSFLGRPNRNYHFYDRRISSYDSTQVEGELDQDLVQQHGLHPMGFFLNTSVNDWQPPRQRTSGQKPVVFRSPSGQIRHASRSVRHMRAEQRATEIQRRRNLREAIHLFAQQQEIPPEEIGPTEEDVRLYRRRILGDRHDEEPLTDEAQAEDQGTQSNDEQQHRADRTAMILEAADVVAGDDAARQQAAQTAARRPQSRPYDAVRDIFTGAEPPAAVAVTEPPPLQSQVNTPHEIYRLSSLAEAAQSVDPREQRQQQQQHQVYQPLDPPLGQFHSTPLPPPQHHPPHYYQPPPPPSQNRIPFTTPSGSTASLPSLRPVTPGISPIAITYGSPRAYFGPYGDPTVPAMLPPPPQPGYAVSPPPFRQPPPLMPRERILHDSPPPPGRPPGPGAGNGKYRKLEPAPVPPHRLAWNTNTAPELQINSYDWREHIKDYVPVEAPPRTGPTTIRGWTHNMLKKGKGVGGEETT